MTPEQKIKHAILEQARNGSYIEEAKSLPEITAANVDEQFEWLKEENSNFYDNIEDFRTTGIETGIPARSHSRHYECEEVAAQMPDGSWVGWTYWRGGGKHGEPSAIGWMEDAYALHVAEEQKTVTVRTFAAA